MPPALAEYRKTLTDALPMWWGIFFTGEYFIYRIKFKFYSFIIDARKS